MNVIQTQNLTKKYGKFTAVDDISFSIKQGEIFGLLGPNGAGKTTTIECIIGLKKPNDGNIQVLDMDALKAGKKLYDYIGVQLQETSYQDKIKVWELCDLFSAMYKNPMDYKKLLVQFGLSEKNNSYVNSLSGGQKQKVAIILALISNPKIIFLDELTTGLDPKARREMWEHVRKLRDEGRTIFITTHYMEEAQYLCDRIGIIDSGKIVALNDVDGVIEQADLHHTVSFYADEDNIKALKNSLGDNANIEYENGKILVHSNNDDIITDVVLALNKNKIEYKLLDIKRPSLEDAYLKLTGKRWES